MPSRAAIISVTTASFAAALPVLCIPEVLQSDARTITHGETPFLLRTEGSCVFKFETRVTEKHNRSKHFIQTTYQLQPSIRFYFDPIKGLVFVFFNWHRNSLNLYFFPFFKKFCQHQTLGSFRVLVVVITVAFSQS